MVSVCIATYNGEQVIKRQVDSILSQLDENDEIIISDDGSSDRTLQVLSDYNDERIKIYHHKKHPKDKHSGEIVAHNFENAIRQAQGDYIFIADQDDEWFPNKVSTFLDHFKKYDMVVSNATVIEVETGKEKGLLYWRRSPLKNYFLKKGKYFGCTMAINRKMKDNVLPFPARIPLHDMWIGLVSELTGQAIYIETPLMYYRSSSKSVSHNVNNSWCYKICYRIYLLTHVYMRVIKSKFNKTAKNEEV